MERICKKAWREYESSLKAAHSLGRGSYGFVTLMVDPIHLRAYAKKTSPMELADDLDKELAIMLRFDNHPCIIRATSPFVHFLNNRDGETVYCYIYTEYANNRSLQKIISDNYKARGPMPEYTVQRAARMILQGLEALHADGYVHCDLKPLNILAFRSCTYGEPFDLKLANFGLSKEPDSPRDYWCSGTSLYMPPEAFRPNIPVDPSRDIWSLGCVVYEMFGGRATKEFSENHYNWRLVEDISPVAKDFLRRCHEITQSRRATAAELLKHPFITQKLDRPPTTRQEADLDWMVIPKLPDSIW